MNQSVWHLSFLALFISQFMKLKKIGPKTTYPVIYGSSKSVGDLKRCFLSGFEERRFAIFPYNTFSLHPEEGDILFQRESPSFD
jgi:hypothetical protein